MDEQLTLEEFWEARYGGPDHVWSGRVNAVVADIAAALPPGRALDLGCGEGGDLVWLAQRGWVATGVDVSGNALARARAAARSAAVPDERLRLVAADLGTWDTDERFDLVTASFLHSPVAIPREQILRSAARLVAAGGHLVVLAHAAAPPWSRPDAHRQVFPTPQSDLAAVVAGGADAWEVMVAETRSRAARGPHGESAILTDSVVHLRRV